MLGPSPKQFTDSRDPGRYSRRVDVMRDASVKDGMGNVTESFELRKRLWVTEVSRFTVSRETEQSREGAALKRIYRALESASKDILLSDRLVDAGVSLTIVEIVPIGDGEIEFHTFATIT